MFPHGSKTSAPAARGTAKKTAFARHVATTGIALIATAALAGGTAGMATADTGRAASASGVVQAAPSPTLSNPDLLIRTEKVVVKRIHEEKRQGAFTLNAYADLVEVRNVRTHRVIRAYLETTVVARSAFFFGFHGHTYFQLGPDYFRTPTWSTGAGPFSTNVYRNTVAVPVNVAVRDARHDGVIRAVMSFH